METLFDVANLVVRPTVVLLVAGLLALALRRSAASTRHIVWAVALGAVLAIPFLGAVVPGIAVPVSEEAARVVRAVPGLAEVVSSGPEAPGPEGVASAQDSTDSILGAIPWLWIWLLGAGTMVGVLAVRVVALRRLETHTLRAADGTLASMLESTRRRLGITRRVTLLIGGEADMPMTWGYLRPRIALPSSASEWPPEQTEAVLLHELAHVRRGDVVVHRIAEITRAVFWFNPLTWYAMRRLLVEREHACDDDVIRAGVRPPEYAHQLLAMANSLKKARVALAASLPMARRSQMTGRLMAILDEGRKRRSPSHRVLSLVAGLALVVAGTASAVRPAAEARDAANLYGCWNPVGRDTNSNRNHDPGEITAEWRTSRCSGDLLILGEVRLRRDSTGFASMAPGSSVRIRETEAGTRREIRVSVDATGSIRVSAEDEAWLRRNLRPLLRLTGIQLPIGSGP